VATPSCSSCRRGAGGRGRPRIADLEAISQRVGDQLNRKLNGFSSPYLRGRRKVSVGYAVVFHNPLIMAERVVGRLVTEAWEAVRIQKRQANFQTRCRLQDVLLGNQITTVFQPIVDIMRGGLLGFEALSRGGRDATARAGQPLQAAQAADLVFELDRHCRRRAADRAQRPRRTCSSSTWCPPRCTTRTSRARASSASSRGWAFRRNGSRSR
jgi:hypothetical protein